jgi:surface polysaccharide O-acyltransferase-like enzyme
MDSCKGNRTFIDRTGNTSKMTENSTDHTLVSQPPPTNKRNEGVELGRLIATIAVIIIHVPSFLSKYFDFAVPYFFTLSGYFFAKKLGSESVDISALRNISLRHWRLFLFWALVYSLFPANWPQLILHGNIITGILETLTDSVNKFSINPINWLLDGPPNGFHLWYLANAPLAAVVVFVFLKFNLRWMLLPLAIASLAILILLTPNQCDGTLQWATRAKVGILIAIPTVIAGVEFGLRSKDRGHALFGSILVLAGAGLKIYELHSLAGYCISTASILIGMGLFILLLDFPRLPYGNLWVALGKMTVGVYILHIAVRPIYFSIAPKIQWFPNSLGFIILTLLTFGVVWALTKFSVFKNWLS